MSSPTEKICSRCHAVFSCGAAQLDESCWCASLPHVPVLADERTDCFCPQCLSEAIAKVAAPEQKFLTTSVNPDRESTDQQIENQIITWRIQPGQICTAGWAGRLRPDRLIRRLWR